MISQSRQKKKFIIDFFVNVFPSIENSYSYMITSLYSIILKPFKSVYLLKRVYLKICTSQKMVFYLLSNIRTQYFVDNETDLTPSKILYTGPFLSKGLFSYSLCIWSVFTVFLLFMQNGIFLLKNVDIIRKLVTTHDLGNDEG